MTKENLKKINIEVTEDCWRILKILAIRKNVPTKQFIRDILEKLSTKNTTELEQQQ